MNKPTIRELLDRMMLYRDSESPYLLAERVEAVLKLHTIMADCVCEHDKELWPCPTLCALNGER